MKNSRRGEFNRILLPGMLAAALLLCGCTIVDEELGGVLPPADAVSVTGVSTGQVLDALGPPSKVGALGDGYAFLYEHAFIREKQFGLSINYTWFRYFKLALGQAQAEREALLLTFDHEGRVNGSGYLEWKEDLGKGNSVQFVITVMSVVDTGEITETPTSVKWGGELLNSRLSESLNRGSSPLLGLNGLEQGGTPSGTGQRTLEMGSYPVLDLNSY